MFLSAMSGVMGTLIGGSATVGTAWITQKKLNRRELIREEPETLLPAYALLNRVRLTASPGVLRMAEALLARITDQYFESNLTVEQMRALARSNDADPLKPFGEACRAELKAIWEDA
jgi:hypothetical protein